MQCYFFFFGLSPGEPPELRLLSDDDPTELDF